MKNCKTSSKKLWAGLAPITMLTLLLSSCLKESNSNYYNPPIAFVTFIQASPDQPPLNFKLDNNLVNANPLNFGDNIGYFNAYAGNRTANFYNANTLAQIYSAPVQFTPYTYYSLFLAGKASQPETVLLTDSISQPAAGNAAIRFINLSPDAPAVDLVVQGGNTLAANKTYKAYSPFMGIQAKATYNLQVVQHGTNTVLATLTNVNLASGYLYTAMLRGLVASTNNSDQLALNVLVNVNYN